MGKLIFEQIDDARAAHPYLFVYFLEDHQIIKVGRGHPFMQIEVTRNNKLSFNFYRIDEGISLNEEHWEKIRSVGGEFLKEILESADE